MAVRVLIVDDSGFFLRRVQEMLDSDPRIEVVGTAANGQEAISKTRELKPDVITMDIEMPVMDGITAVKRIMSIQPTPVLMFSSLTHQGAQATFDALDAGALDFLPKNFDDISNNREEVTRILRSRVWTLGVKGLPAKPKPEKPGAMQARTRSSLAPSGQSPVTRPARKANCKLVAIGTSTGGPVALQEVLTQIPAGFSAPIILIQHMPASFTLAFAKRLNTMCKIEVREAQDGDVLKPGVALLAPGGKQMIVESPGGTLKLRITESEPGQNYKPSVDVTFSSVAKVLPGKSLAIVMTGMGADGREGARELKQGGATIWAQDEASSVIYGMPMAIVEAGLADAVLPLSKIGTQLAGAV